MLCCSSPAAPHNTTNSFKIHFHLIFLRKVLPIIDLSTIENWKNLKISLDEVWKMCYIKKTGITAGSVFVTKNGKPLNRSNIWRDMKALCEKAGVSPKKVFPHNLRHLFARPFYSIDKDIVRLADILGHSNINTTRIYTMETGKAHLKKIERLQRRLIT